MKLMNRDSSKRMSLDSFKAKADALSVQESIHKITGGTMAGCHPIKPE